jgi:hypothetical protein
MAQKISNAAISENVFDPVVLSEPLAEELRLLKESLALAVKRAAEAGRGGFLERAPRARNAQLADEKLQAIKRRIAEIEGRRRQ